MTKNAMNMLIILQNSESPDLNQSAGMDLSTLTKQAQ